MMKTTNDNVNHNTTTITTEEQIMINAKYQGGFMPSTGRERDKTRVFCLTFSAHLSLS
jgi:hypothetical protein